MVVVAAADAGAASGGEGTPRHGQHHRLVGSEGWFYRGSAPASGGGRGAGNGQG